MGVAIQISDWEGNMYVGREFMPLHGVDLESLVRWTDVTAALRRERFETTDKYNYSRMNIRWG